MKKFTSILVLLLMVLPSAAQKLKWGLQGGLDLRKVELKSSVYDTDNRVGWFVGPKASVKLPLGFSVDGAVMYNHRYLDFDAVGATAETLTAPAVDGAKQNLSYLIVPVDLRYTISLLSMLGVYVSTGPQWDLHMGNSRPGSLKDLDAKLKTSAFSWNASVGVKALKHVHVQFTYNYGIDHMLWSGPLATTVKDLKDSRHSYQASVFVLL